MNIDNIVKHMDWEEYYDPNFNWNNSEFYKNNILSEEFIEEFKNKINWYFLGLYKKSTDLFSESFIETYQKYVNWDWISFQDNLSEKFIHKFRYKLNWNMVSEYSKMSDRFILKHRKFVCWDKILSYQNISFDLREKIETKLVLKPEY